MKREVAAWFGRFFPWSMSDFKPGERICVAGTAGRLPAGRVSVSAKDFFMGFGSSRGSAWRISGFSMPQVETPG
ncbi:hypothetical protein D5272_09330 [bacterium D16-76]|nr:hypothetical protein [bacterium D16-76]